ncbi:MAG: peptide chain release factor 1 [Bacilli bacterium]|nr:peptide chain release factor 1 [Bacilli bacterium]
MIERLNDIEKRYNEISEELSKQDIILDIKKATELSKEQKSLEEIVVCFLSYKKSLEEIKETKKMLEDKEFVEFAKEELLNLETKKQEIEDKLEVLLVPKDESDDKNVIMEIRGAAGGDEANIFAGDLFDMYVKYIESYGWNVEVIHEVKGVSGGYSQIEFIVKGKGAYSKLKYESGTHRVQRVPDTETQGRVHTSTATVAVLPEQEGLDIEVKESDIKVDVYRSSGAGGQSVNTTDSAVRMTHLPTGIVVTCQNERSQIKNKEKALQILKSKIYEERLREKDEKESNERRTKIGTGDRSEKIRTYNYPQNRITDHRINFTTMQLDRVMLGKLEEIIEQLTIEDQKRKLSRNV